MPWVLVLILIGAGGAAMTRNEHGPQRILHYAPNHNFDDRGRWRPGAAGFNLADINDLAQLRQLPSGVKGLIWVGRCDGAGAAFVAQVKPYLHQAAVFGFYLMDDPDPRPGRAQCKPSSLRTEADWIHSQMPEARTFIVLMNLATAAAPSFAGTYTPANSHVDLYGIDPYPCRSEVHGCSDQMIERYVAAAEAAGISREQMIPVFQAFGGGRWQDGDGGEYLLPTAAQTRAMLAQWRSLIPAPVFDYSYSWGDQRGDRALENSLELQKVLSEHNTGIMERATTPD